MGSRGLLVGLYAFYKGEGTTMAVQQLLTHARGKPSFDDEVSKRQA